jgi:hypothetical protein
MGRCHPDAVRIGGLLRKKITYFRLMTKVIGIAMGYIIKLLCFMMKRYKINTMPKIRSNRLRCVISSQDSSVGIATGYGLRAGRPELYSPQAQEIFLYFTASRPALGPTQPPIQWVSGPLSPRARRQVRETHLYLVSRSRIMELYVYSHIRLHSVVLS